MSCSEEKSSVHDLPCTSNQIYTYLIHDCISVWHITDTGLFSRHTLLEINYPTIETPKVVAGKEILNSPYILALIRQESEFDASANSWVGARGLMQIMPATGKILGKRTKLGYSIQKLTTDEYYNIKLGSYYITELYENFGNNIYLALAAYNAGPHRVSRWLKKYGDPRKNEIDTIDFLEHIRFAETRNYVQRVIENIHVYKYILENKPTKNQIQPWLYMPYMRPLPKK